MKSGFFTLIRSTYRNGWTLTIQPNLVPSENSTKKLLVSVWWASAGVVQYSCLKPGQMITAGGMIKKLVAKQPRLVHRSTLLLLHDNPRPHIAQQMATKLKELQLECLRHPSTP